MSETKAEYRIVSRGSYLELADDINVLAAGGYEVVGYGPGRDVYPSAVMRLKPDVIEREHPVPEFAATVMQLDIRVRALEADLERYLDTHAETHRFDDARAREFGECNATLLRASLKQTVQLATLEQRVVAAEDRLNGSNEFRLLDLDSRVKALEASATCGGVWRKSDAD